MNRDYVLTGALVGIAADVFRLLINYIGYLLNFTQVVFWQITATRFLEKKDLFKPIAYIIGGIADITVAALLGVMFVYFIYYVGNRYLLIKGIGFGLAVWVGIFGTLVGVTVQQKLPQTPSGIMVTIIAHLFFGLALAVFTGRLNMKKVHVYKKKGS